MFNNISYKIKVISLLSLICSVVGGAIWLIFSVTQYVKYKEFLQFENLSRFYNTAVIARQGIVYSLVLLIGGIISSYLIYGFGEIIESLNNIDSKLKDEAKETSN
jgi:hypothetical protein